MVIQNRQREVKNNIGNDGEAKELIFMTHGHELRGNNPRGSAGGAGWKGMKGREKMGQLS